MMNRICKMKVMLSVPESSANPLMLGWVEKSHSSSRTTLCALNIRLVTICTGKHCTYFLSSSICLLLKGTHLCESTSTWAQLGSGPGPAAEDNAQICGRMHAEQNTKLLQKRDSLIKHNFGLKRRRYNLSKRKKTIHSVRICLAGQIWTNHFVQMYFFQKIRPFGSPWFHLN